MKLLNQKNRSIKAVLFDLDGTLIDSMSNHYAAWKSTLNEEFSINIKPNDFYPLEGVNLKKIPEILIHKYKVQIKKIDTRAVIKKKENYYLKNKKLKYYPFVKQTIKLLKKRGIKTAIVTSGLRDRLYKSIPIKFLQEFNVIVTGDDTKVGKPSKMPFVKAMSKIGIKNKNCLVVENAPLGIAAAKNANIFCIALESTLNKRFLKEADLVLPSFNEFYKFAKKNIV